MKKTVTVKQASDAYNALKAAKVTKMEGAEKVAVVKAVRALKPVAAALADFEEEAREKMKPEGFEEAAEKSRVFDSLPDAEKAEVNRVFIAYHEAMEKCMGEENSREEEIEAASLTEEAFARLADSNDFDIETIMTLQDVLCE